MRAGACTRPPASSPDGCVHAMVVKNRFGLPDLGLGLGLRSVHYRTILSKRPPVDFFEILSENYLRTEGRPLEIVEEVAAHYPIVMHGVSLSIGSADPLDYG